MDWDEFIEIDNAFMVGAIIGLIVAAFPWIEILTPMGAIPLWQKLTFSIAIIPISILVTKIIANK